MTYQFDFLALVPYWRDLLAGCLMTLSLAALSVSLGFVVGLGAAILRDSSIAPLRWVASTYVELIRNTPFLLQVLFIFFGLPALGLSLAAWPAAVLALTLNCGAFASEIIRSGVDAIPRGQIEAGKALGLSGPQVFRFIVLKPALRIIFPALSGQFILALLTTSIASSISAEELTSVAQSIDTLTFRSFEIYIVITILYFIMSYGFSALFKMITRIYFSYPTK
ncbi:amino acid ABC transporter permease [Mesorhizobium sp. CGMCC 1.15528]|uniref:Glutamate/aspartate import permease protein GltK n=1 Tax=Mesorhizobium zhangyense TaxID=1776730 RepID=A0A7C9VC03_9HYPH|nr:amino acid ABC transporter permease [Mesorhizobium zhangyense]NGN43566.1 amino acid ABC transporter permease [Mesorhizobium zhangyense]